MHPSNPTSSKALSPKELQQLVDKLEASLTIMHGSAYVPASQAVRILKVAAKGTTSLNIEWMAATSLAMELRRMSGTVARPASERMVAAADALEGLVAGN